MLWFLVFWVAIGIVIAMLDRAICDHKYGVSKSWFEDIENICAWPIVCVVLLIDHMDG